MILCRVQNELPIRHHIFIHRYSELKYVNAILINGVDFWCKNGLTNLAQGPRARKLEFNTPEYP